MTALPWKATKGGFIFKPTFHLKDLNLSSMFFSFLYSIPIVFVFASVTASIFGFVLQEVQKVLMFYCSKIQVEANMELKLAEIALIKMA